MSTTFVVGYVGLWFLFLLQSLAILLLLRQVGALHLRIRPMGARVLPAGPEIGESAPALALVDMDDRVEQIEVSGSMEKDVLLLFLSPHCAACAELIPAIKPLVRESNGDLRWAIVASGGRESSRKFRREYAPNDLLFAYAPKAREQYKIGPTPYAVLIRADGVVLSKGVVNHMEHVESILETRNQTTVQATNPPSGELA